jgi:ATP-dependent DNA helicase DinG
LLWVWWPARLVALGARESIAECAGVAGALAMLQAPADALNLAIKRARLALDRFPAKGAMTDIERDAVVEGDLAALRDALSALADALSTHAERSRGLASAHERALAHVARWHEICDTAARDSVH